MNNRNMNLSLLTRFYVKVQVQEYTGIMINILKVTILGTVVLSVLFFVLFVYLSEIVEIIGLQTVAVEFF